MRLFPICSLLLILTVLPCTPPLRSQWVRVDIPRGIYVHSLLVADSNVYAGTSGGVYRSAINTVAWSAVNNGITDPDIQSLAAVGSTLLACTFSGVFRSTDQGGSWTAANNGLAGSRIWRLTISGTTLFAAGWSVFRSTDAGETWVPSNGGLSPYVNVNCITALGADLYLGTTQGLFHSSDNGTTWVSAGIGLPPSSGVDFLDVNATSVFAATGNGGIFRSTDRGASWVQANSGLPGVYIFALGISDTEHLFVATDLGVYHSTDNGSSWTPAGNGAAPNVHCFAFSGPKLFAGAGGGIFLSTDHGSSWTVQNDGFPYAGAFFLVPSAKALYLGNGAGVYHSLDNGQHWLGPDPGLESNGPITAMAFLDNDLFAASGQGSGVFRSTDNGVTWRPASNGLPPYKVVSQLVGSGTTLFAGYGYYSVYRSTDFGSQWTELSYSGSYVGSLLLRGTDVYITDGAFVQVSTDAGTTWRRSSAGLPGVTIVSLAADRTHLYAGTRSMGIYRSADHGLTWSSAGALFQSSNVQVLLATDTVLVAGSNAEVFYTTDGGSTWFSGHGTFQSNVQSLILSGTSLFALVGSEVWRRPISELTAFGEPTSELPEEYLLGQNYPNPFNPSTTIRYALPHRSHVTLAIYNVLGQQVATLVNGDMEAGSHEVQFNAGQLASGVYFYRLQAGGFVQIRSLVILR